MTTVRHILEDKGREVWSVRPGDKVYDAIKMMADKDVGSLVVLGRQQNSRHGHGTPLRPPMCS